MKHLYIICLLSLIVTAMADNKELDILLHDGSNQFTAKMFSEVAKGNPGKSIVVSAYSVMTPLAQLALASVGETHDEILRSIGMPNDNATKAVFSYANAKVKSAKEITLITASKIYLAKKYELNDNFAAISRDVFGSDVQNVDFLKNQETANKVNAWVENQTNHHIKDLVKADSLTEDTRALLVNAIYFKGFWKYQFSKQETKARDFHVTKDEVIQVPTMYRKGDYQYAESEELKSQVLKIPYEGDKSYILIVLPRKIDGITEVEEKLQDPSVLDRAIEYMYETEVEVYLPKFKIETTTNLKDVLKKMDVSRIFDSKKARLENLIKDASNLHISDAIQKASIEVNEEGAVATVANTFGMVHLSPSIPYTIKFQANHPFLFFLYEENNILFSGVFYS